MGCEKKDTTRNPDEAGDEAKGDSLEQLKAIPGEIQAEVDLALKPITDAESLMADLETAPERLKISAGDLGAALKAAFDADASADAEGVKADVNVDISKLDVTAEAQAEIEAMIAKVREIKAGLVASPKTVSAATANVVALGGKAVALGTKVTTGLTAKLKFATGEKAAELQAQLAEAEKVVADSKALVQDAKAQLTEIPAKAADMGVKLTASFAAGGSAKTE